ncbi:MAG: extracellular solute-binding protein [Verrucomicrobia bacterium]|nr:extracellular solute-binding protein [Verrucomicrobiota bacterium]
MPIADRKSICFIRCGLAFLLLCACMFLRAEAGREPVTVKVFSLPDKSLSVGVWRGMAEAVDVFRAKNPHIRLVRSTQLTVEGHTMDAGALMAIAGGISPDVIYVNFRQSESYIQQGFLRPLDEFINLEWTAAEARSRGAYQERVMYRDEYEERVPEPVRPVIHRKGPDGKEHFYAMPYGMVVGSLIYRKDLFLEAGLDPDRPPRDWDEYFECARKLTNPEKGIYGTALGDGKESSYYLFPFLNSAGADAVKQLPDGEWRAAFDTPEAVEAYFFFNKLFTHPWRFNGKPMRGFGYRGPALGEKWNDGKIGMLMTDLFDKELSGVNPELYGIAPEPRGPSGVSSPAINCLMMGIFAGIKDRGVRDAAWEYMRFVDGPDARRIITKHLVESGGTKFLNPLYLKRYGYPELAPLVQKGLFEVYQDGVKTGKPEPYGKNCQLVYDYLTQPMDELYFRTIRGEFDGKSEKEMKAQVAVVLQRAVAETNEKMIGYLPAEKKRVRHAAAWVAVAMVAASFALMFRRIFSTFAGATGSKTQWGFVKYKGAYLVLLPAMLLIAVWQYYPLGRGSFMAFQDYMIIGGSRWIGLENFANVLFDASFWHSFGCSLYFLGLTLAFGFFPPIFLAILLQEVPRGKVVFRTLFYLPAVISPVVVMFLWKQFFDISEHGLLNQIIHLFGIPPQKWLGDPKLAMLCIVIPLAWATMGPGCIIYLAALKSIPDDLYEAAEIDGAGFRSKVFSIVLPFLKPLLVINFVGAFIGAFKSVDYILAMTGGGPADATNVVGMQIFNQSFLYLKFGLATAMAWILGSMLLGFTAMQLQILRRVEFRQTGLAK